jgi:hypothetical protein
MVSLMNSEIITLAARFLVERVTRIELALSAWEADVLPLNYTRRSRQVPGDGHLGDACSDIVPDKVGCSRAPLRS